MAQQKMTSNKENIPFRKPKAGKVYIPVSNVFQILEGRTGNAYNVLEFEAEGHDAGVVFFKLDPDCLEKNKKIAEDRVKILNFIHLELKVDMDRVVPGEKFDRSTEILHRGIYQGLSLDVGVHYYMAGNGMMTAQAFVKPTDAECDDMGVWGGAVWAEHAASTDEALKDKATAIVNNLDQFYWTPRWKYIVKYLHERMHTFNHYGDKAPEFADPEITFDDVETDVAVVDENAEIEDEIQVYAGCSGRVIGVKGIKIQEIKAASGVRDIKMPVKDENNRPRGRQPITIKIFGTKSAAKKAASLIRAIERGWVKDGPPGRSRYGAHKGGNRRSNASSNGNSGDGGSVPREDGADHTKSAETAAEPLQGSTLENDASAGVSWADEVADAADAANEAGSRASSST